MKTKLNLSLIAVIAIVLLSGHALANDRQPNIVLIIVLLLSVCL